MCLQHGMDKDSSGCCSAYEPTSLTYKHDEVEKRQLQCSLGTRQQEVHHIHPPKEQKDDHTRAVMLVSKEECEWEAEGPAPLQDAGIRTLLWLSTASPKLRLSAQQP